MRHTDERHAALQELTCDRCAAVVKVTKFSPQHTSVQWNEAAAGACAEFAGRTAGELGVQRARIRTCASLWESIDRAVLDGRLAVESP